jgi:hypothetical protein
MAQIKPLLDEYGVIYDSVKLLPTEKLKTGFLEALAELEDNECHRTRQFPRTRLHRVTGIKQQVYRADVDKGSGYRLHVQYIEGRIHLIDIIEGQKHDDVIKVISAKRSRYQ